MSQLVRIFNLTLLAAQAVPLRGERDTIRRALAPRLLERGG